MIEERLTTFQADTTRSILPVRRAMTDLLDAMGTPINRPTDLQKTLGIDSKLSWQVFNLIRDPAPLAAATLVPGEPSLKRLIAAALKYGVDQAVANSVQSAVEAFNEVYKQHAEDRAEFNFMASVASSVADAEAADLEYRRMAFRSDSHIWGVCADVLGGITIVRRAADGVSTDECSIANKLGLRRLRLDASTTAFAFRNYGAGEVPATNRRLPLDAAAAEKYGAHILPRFCSQPIPPLVTRQRLDGYTAFDVQSREIGRLSSIDMTFGSVFRNCPLARDLDGTALHQTDMRLSTPSRALVSCVLVHRPSFGDVTPTLMNFRQSPGDDNVKVAMSVPQIDPYAEVTRSSDVNALHIPEIPEYRALIQYAFDELGWNPSEFDAHCIRIAYPVLHCVVRVQFRVNA